MDGEITSRDLMTVVNVARRLEHIFPGYFAGSVKHDHYKDFGYPEHLTFNDFWRRYRRNGIARAGIDKTESKTWQDSPQVLQSERSDEETPAESDLRERFEALRVWQRLAEADRRSMVGSYAGVILRLADDKRFNEPVETVRGGLAGLVEIIPAWEGQLRPAEWDTNELSETYGQPLMYRFIETAVIDGADAQNKQRSFMIHPDRVVIWSRTGDVHGESMLEAGYNDLLIMEKVAGAGGEGFWKNARSAPHMNVGAEAKLADLAAALGVGLDGIADKLNEVVGDFQKGFDKALITQGMDVKTLGITLPQPQEFYDIALMGFAASIGIPIKILVGSQTGERASVEDAREWAQTCQSRRQNIAIPNIRELINRLVRFGVLADAGWSVEWSDLTESSMVEKIDRADKMASVNHKMAQFGRVVFEGDEIRDVVGLPALGDTFGDDDDAAVADALREAAEA